MITSMIGLALLAPTADTPIEPISSALIEMSMGLDEAGALCDSIAEVGSSIEMLALIEPSMDPLLGDMAVAYYTDMLEDSLGWDQSLSPEAEDIYEGWLNDCLNR